MRFNVYAWHAAPIGKGAPYRTADGPRGYAERVWQGEARSIPGAILEAMRALQAHGRGDIPYRHLFARAADADEWARDQATIISA